jgi:DNA-binding beta-propeller fold protein YncE
MNQPILHPTEETTPRKEWKRPGLVILLAAQMMCIGILTASPDAAFAQSVLAGVGGSPSATPTPPPNNVIYTFNTNANPEGIAISPDSKTLYVACPGANTVDVVNATISDYPITANLNAPNPPGGNLVYDSRAITLNPAGTTLYVALTNGESSPGSVVVYDTTQNTYPHTIITTQGAPNSVTVTADGTLLYVTEENFATPFFGVEVFNTSTQALVATISTGGYPVDLQFTNGGQQADVLNLAGSGGLQFIDTGTETLSGATVGGRIFYPQAMTINGVATKLFVADGDNYVTACNAVTGAAIGNPFLFGPSPLSSAVSGQPGLTPNGKYLYIPQVSPAASGYQVVMLSTSTGAVVGSPIAVGNVPVSATVAPNGKALYVSNSSDATVTVVNTKP